MAKLDPIVSATIVLIFCAQSALAAPAPDVPESKPKGQESHAGTPDDSLAISEPLEVIGTSAPTGPRYYPYHQALSFRVGRESDFPKMSFDDSVTGFQYLFPKFLAPKLEAGADLLEGGRGHIHAGMRWIWSERSYFRPSLKAGLDHLVESKEGLATLTRLENYYLRTSGIIEYTVWNPASIRLESELLFNFDKVRLMVTAGLSWGW